MTGQVQLISTGQAAVLLGVTARTAHQYAQRGKLRVALVTLGGHRRYRVDDVEALRARMLVSHTEQCST